MIKKALKKLRVSQPFNAIATSALRAGFRATGLKSELVIGYMYRVGLIEDRLPNGRMLRLFTRGGDDVVSNEIYWRGWDGYEPETIPLFYRLAERASVTIDVGAHIGLFTLLAAHANPRGEVYAFEPLATTHEWLKQNLALNDAPNVHCVMSAAGAENGVAQFYFEPTNRAPETSSLLLDSIRQTAASADLQHVDVPVTTLDTFVRERGIERVDLLKLDTEGTEPDILRGMASAIERDRPTILCEVLTGFKTEAALEAALAPHGYKYYLLTPDGPKRYDRIVAQPEGRWELRNYLFSVLDPSEVERL